LDKEKSPARLPSLVTTALTPGGLRNQCITIANARVVDIFMLAQP
jgi:hypothetical protein